MTKKLTEPSKHIMTQMLPVIMAPSTPRAGFFGRWAEKSELRHLREVAAVKSEISNLTLLTIQSTNQAVIEYISAPKKLQAELNRIDAEDRKRNAEAQKSELENALLSVEYENALLDLKLKKKEVSAIVDE
jgi:hypothetical protein